MFALPTDITVSISTLLGWLRDLAASAGIGVFLWKARGWWDELVGTVTKFFDRQEEHMNRMEKFADVMVTNHVKHMEDSLVEINKSLRELRGEHYVIDPTKND